jgi:hypothetical protein
MGLNFCLQQQSSHNQQNGEDFWGSLQLLSTSYKIPHNCEVFQETSGQ